MAVRLPASTPGLLPCRSAGPRQLFDPHHRSHASVDAFNSKGLHMAQVVSRHAAPFGKTEQIVENCAIWQSKAHLNEQCTKWEESKAEPGQILRIPKQSSPLKKQKGSNRRVFLSGVALAAGLSQLEAPVAAAGGTVSQADFNRIEALLVEATEAWERGLDPTNLNRFLDLYRACERFDRIVEINPERTEWLEARGQVEVDAKRFNEALADFNEAIRREPGNYHAYASRALAYEGLAQWERAVADYSAALQLGQAATGGRLEPYVMNSRGNAYMSEGNYREALRDYEESYRGFQAARELDGAIYAASNAALARIQLGEEKEGMRGLAAVARRAPASIDMRAALAAIYWHQGMEQKAEDEWNFACENINPGQVFDGCAKYRDLDWLRRIRRWPPVMVQRMEDFLRLRSASG